jgi:hypothetical protein
LWSIARSSPDAPESYRQTLTALNHDPHMNASQLTLSRGDRDLRRIFA